MFIVLEGIEGSGKSSLLISLCAALAAQYDEVLATREPGATALGAEIRKLLLNGGQNAPKPAAELMLFFADRAQHVEELIRPALARGAIVLCDRYCYSTFAYQGFGRGLNVESLRQLNAVATGGLEPGLVFLLDLEPEQGLRRARSRAAEGDQSWTRFEQEELDFHHRIRDGFLTLAADTSGNTQWRVLDASKPAEAVFKEAWDHLSLFLKEGARQQ